MPQKGRSKGRAVPAAPVSAVPAWHTDAETGRTTALRAAQFWQPTGKGRVTCTLCYRRCDLAPGEAGWCKYRANERGLMELRAHGVLSDIAPNVAATGRGNDGLRLYKPGTPWLHVGGVNCTAGCTFCFSRDVAWHPERVPWVNGEQRLATRVPHGGGRAMAHPGGLVSFAREIGCTGIAFGGNEPTLSFEYTYDVARMAKGAGMDVALYTNGFTTPKAIEMLARFVDVIVVGIKGSADPDFYAKWVRSPGAPPAILDALRTWHAAGTRVEVSDVLAPRHMQPDDTFDERVQQLYGWVAETLGPLTPLHLAFMRHHIDANELLLPAQGNQLSAKINANLRIERAQEVAGAAGLRYALVCNDVDCHACGGALLRFPRPPVPAWGHAQYVTDGRCDHCGVAVPIVTLPRAEVDAHRQVVAAWPAEGWS